MTRVILLRRVLMILTYATLLFGGAMLGHVLMDFARVDIRPSGELMLDRMILAAAFIFSLAAALPFVPGVEIGLALLLVFGHRIALLVYLAMVIAPVVTYLVGRLVPVVSTAQVFRYLGLSRARDMALRLAALFEHAPRRWLPALLRYRICALVLLFNLPVNALIGGGGGIAFAAGLSRLYHFPSYLLAVAVAVAPVPLLFVLMG
jgi:hypothetical protein